MARHGSAPTRKHESHPNSVANGNLNNQITQPGSKPLRSTLDADSLAQVDQETKAYWAAAAREYDLKGVPRKSHEITPNLKRRARRLAVDGWVDHNTRQMIRYALENRDPYLIQLVTRVERGEKKVDHLILDTD